MRDTFAVLRSTRDVVLDSGFVKINQEAVKKLAQDLAKTNRPGISEPFFLVRGWKTEEKIGLYLLFNAINYSFWPSRNENRWVVRDAEENILDGSTACLWCLENAAFQGILSPTDFIDLRNVSPFSLENIFHSYQGNRIPMLDQRLASLRQLGEHLDFRKPADLKALIKSWGGSAEKAVAFLIQLPVFDDTEVWRTVNGNLKIIKFYKRAQLAAKMINQVLFHEMPDYAFQDLEILTAFADYRLPQVLRGMGVLEYLPILADYVDREVNILAGSPEEIAIRSATVWASENLRLALENVWQEKVTAAQVDEILWYKARELKDSLAPHHQTRTTAY